MRSRMADTPRLYDLLRLMPEDDPRTFSRRKMLSATGLAVAAGVAGMPALQRAAASGATTATPHLDRTQAATPFPLPGDAAPADKQVFYIVNDSNFAKVMDFYEAVYERAGATKAASAP